MLHHEITDPSALFDQLLHVIPACDHLCKLHIEAVCNRHLHKEFLDTDIPAVVDMRL